jgi:hypothetical protein
MQAVWRAESQADNSTMVSKELVLSFQSIVNKWVRFIPRLSSFQAGRLQSSAISGLPISDAPLRGLRPHVLPGHAPTRRPEPEARCADLPSPLERAAKRCRTRGNYRGSGGPRRDRPWSPTKVSRRWPPREDPLAWKSCARLTQPRAARRTSGTRYRSIEPQLPALEFLSCSGDIHERPRFTSRNDRLQ